MGALWGCGRASAGNMSRAWMSGLCIPDWVDNSHGTLLDLLQSGKVEQSTSSLKMCSVINKWVDFVVPM